MRKVALMHVISKEEIDFFSRFEKSVYKKGLSSLYVTTSIFCFILLKIKSKKVYLSKRNNSLDGEELNIESYFNNQVGWLTKKQSDTAYCSMYQLARKLISLYDVKVAFIPSGRLASHQGLERACKELSVSTIFSGYGNFPGKTFFDKTGTDKNSTLFSSKASLESFVFNEKCQDKFNDWKVDFLSQKIKSHVVTQAKKVTKKTYISRFARIVFCKLEKLFGVAIDVDRPWRSIFEFSKVDYSPLESSLPKNKFLFLPLQFSKDAQLILNYHGDVISSMEQSLKLAKEKGLELIIKPHPVDNSSDVYQHIEDFLKNDGVSLSMENTFKLIDAAELVVTVNSTVGLEAKLMNKPVIFLGDSLYAGMTEAHIYSYLFNYLVDIDYFSDSDITDSNLNKIFKMCGVNI